MQSHRSVEPSPVVASKPGSTQAESSGQVRLNDPLIRLVGKTKLLAILLILIGVIYCASIIGLVIGWAPIRLGLQMRKMTQQLNEASKSQNAQQSQTLLAEIHRLIPIGRGVLMSLTAIAIVAVGFAIWQAV